MNEINSILVGVNVDKGLAGLKGVSQFIQDRVWWQCILLPPFRAQSECHCKFVYGKRSACSSHPTEDHFCDVFAVGIDLPKDSVVDLVEV